jgi:hypothetical protein
MEEQKMGKSLSHAWPFSRLDQEIKNQRRTDGAIQKQAA